MTPALFITLEGTDGSGISTQTARLAAWFRAEGLPVHATKEPSSGPIGLLLRLALTHRIGHVPDAESAAETAFHPLDETAMALLFAADRIDHLAVDVLPRLEQGVSVVSDRYALSSYAIQGLSIELDWLRSVNARARTPDLTILLDVPPEVSVERMRARGTVERYERYETLERVRANFHRLVPVLRAAGQRIAVVDGSAPIDAVREAIVSTVRERRAALTG